MEWKGNGGVLSRKSDYFMTYYFLQFLFRSIPFIHLPSVTLLFKEHCLTSLMQRIETRTHTERRKGWERGSGVNSRTDNDSDTALKRKPFILLTWGKKPNDFHSYMDILNLRLERIFHSYSPKCIYCRNALQICKRSALMSEIEIRVHGGRVYLPMEAMTQDTMKSSLSGEETRTEDSMSSWVRPWVTCKSDCCCCFCHLLSVICYV